jgi:hypothetical protein
LNRLVTLYLAAPSASPELVLPTFKAARDVGAPITIHVGVTPAGATGLLEKLNAEKALGADTTYVHCCAHGGDASLLKSRATNPSSTGPATGGLIPLSGADQPSATNRCTGGDDPELSAPGKLAKN